MLSIAIYDDNKESVLKIKDAIQDYLIETHTLAKVSCFNKAEEFLITPGSYDIYIMDIDSSEDINALKARMGEIDSGSYFIFMGTDPTLACSAYKVDAESYLLKPVDKAQIFKVLSKIKQKVKDEVIIVKTGDGDRRVKIPQVNYINIVKWCLCYHLKDGNVFDGQTLRTSFEKAITPLDSHPSFYFIPPSLLINLGEIKIIDTNHIIFENDSVLYFPKKSYDAIYTRWKEYNKIT